MIYVVGTPDYTGALLVHKLVKAGHKVKASKKLLYRNDMDQGHSNVGPDCGAILIEVEDGFYDKEKIKKTILGCNFVIYLPQQFNHDSYKTDYDAFTTLVDIAQACGIERFIYVLRNSEYSELFIEYLKSRELDNLIVMVVDVSEIYGNASKQKLGIPVATFTQRGTVWQKMSLYASKQKKTRRLDMDNRLYANCGSDINDIYVDGLTELYLCLSGQPLKEIQKKTWPDIMTYRFLLDRFSFVFKLFKMLKKPYVPLRVKFFFQSIKRLFDVSCMLFLVHFWPEQAYRFSVRKLLPSKDMRYRLIDRPIIPFEVIESKTSDIPRMKEANIVLRGTSFKSEQLEELDSPIFLASFWEPVKTKKDVTYIVSDVKNAFRLAKLGCKVIYLETNLMDDNGCFFPDRGCCGKQLIEESTCRRIALVKKVFDPTKPSPGWAPTGGLSYIGVLYHFAEKINVYGWDFYLESSPDTMNYWQLLSNMYKLKLDLTRSRSHLEMATITFYYAYHLSKLPNVNIYGHMGQLGKHEKLIGKLERVLFNV
ncbi:MAG: NmrA family NAD(P)-binding protein [Candidatus Omnitrophica bacterium]|nr:NmrA family NAD(P)-binding protein [Candidatus Omnitrophota bacterium]